MGKLWKLLFTLIVVAIVLAPLIAPLLTGTAFAAAFPFITAAFTGVAALGWVGSIALGLGLGYLVDPETTSEIVDTVSKGVTDLVDAAVGVVGNAVSSVFSWPLLVIGGLAAFFILSDKKKDEKTKIEFTGPGNGNVVPQQ